MGFFNIFGIANKNPNLRGESIINKKEIDNLGSDLENSSGENHQGAEAETFAPKKHNLRGSDEPSSPSSPAAPSMPEIKDKIYSQYKPALRGTPFVFVEGILSKLYLLISVPAMFIAYIVLKKLKEMGVIDSIFNKISKEIEIIEKVATECTGLILQLHEFYQCLEKFK